MRETLLLVEHQLKSWSNILVETDLADDVPPVLCERNQIAQVLINLMTNARDAMPDGGSITIRTRRDAGRRDVVLQVIDSGSGVPDEIRDKIFDPFFTTKPLGAGTGLGLSIIASIIHDYGGSISLENAEPRGAVFTIRIPEEMSNLPDGQGFPNHHF